MFELTGKVAIVTGASSGLGADSARAYAKNGANVALFARRIDRLTALADELESMGVSALPVQCDVIDEAQVKHAVEQVIQRFGSIDILLNNAGVAVTGGVHTLTQEDWDKSMDVNVKGLFLMSKYVIPHMMEKRYGKVVNISSVNAQIADKEDTLMRHGYNASKSAVRGLTLGMAASYGKYNITVNSIGPGLFESEMTKDTLFQAKDWLETYTEQCPMGRPGARGEVAGTVLYLSSDASSYVTGQYIIIDGGFSLV